MILSLRISFPRVSFFMWLRVVSQSLWSLWTSEAVCGNPSSFFQVVVTLMKKAEKKGAPLHELKILHLGLEAKVKAHDMTAEAYLREISMRCFDFPGRCAGPSVERQCRPHNQINTALHPALCLLCVFLTWPVWWWWWNKARRPLMRSSFTRKPNLTLIYLHITWTLRTLLNDIGRCS